ncbi:hypothetical protein ROZALSC1DRAFT_31623 [Rozella allomycis CSF55]|uniref:Uncharacterized protein n=1 Tax=Rozella allomycis (strain CSF55) TaxID=988480 RepID=A0A075AQS9_ROZAC|nr:hypothetical protein O9G_006344 [Rozella allomycis CSF55]RKP16445.1 hypothetical protein ROZALSC1DRAFT_31623 [Rozella allomycis CSF55]|eukprot:EPZ30947.1 hypothetical protein O9G_006344 [Rozella allomycis CSF55]
MLAQSLSASNLESLNLEQSGDSSEISKIDQSQGLNNLFNVLPNTKLVHLKLKNVCFSDKFDVNLIKAITSSKLRTLEISFVCHHDSQVNAKNFYDSFAGLAQILRTSRLERIAFEVKCKYDRENLNAWEISAKPKFSAMGYLLDSYKESDSVTISISAMDVFNSSTKKSAECNKKKLNLGLTIGLISGVGAIAALFISYMFF